MLPRSEDRLKLWTLKSEAILPRRGLCYSWRRVLCLRICWRRVLCLRICCFGGVSPTHGHSRGLETRSVPLNLNLWIRVGKTLKIMQSFLSKLVDVFEASVEDALEKKKMLHIIVKMWRKKRSAKSAFHRSSSSSTSRRNLNAEYRIKTSWIRTIDSFDSTTLNLILRYIFTKLDWRICSR